MGVHGLADRVRDGVLLGVLRGFRPCEHAVQVPAICADDSGCALPSIHRQSWTFLLSFAQCKLCRRPSSFPGVALGPFLDMPVVVQRHMHSLGCQGRRHLRRGADAVSYGPVVQKTMRFLGAVHIRVVDVTVGQVQQIPRVLSV